MQEAKQLFTKLCAKLDALSHLSLVPKPVVSDLEVRVDTAAIAMEEAAPVTSSVANLRAPEEVHAAVRRHCRPTASPIVAACSNWLMLLMKCCRPALRTAEALQCASHCATHGA